LLKMFNAMQKTLLRLRGEENFLRIVSLDQIFCSR
jgi:hypothetical protein